MNVFHALLRVKVLLNKCIEGEHMVAENSRRVYKTLFGVWFPLKLGQESGRLTGNGLQ